MPAMLAKHGNKSLLTNASKVNTPTSKCNITNNLINSTIEMIEAFCNGVLIHEKHSSERVSFYIDQKYWQPFPIPQPVGKYELIEYICYRSFHQHLRLHLRDELESCKNEIRPLLLFYWTKHPCTQFTVAHIDNVNLCEEDYYH